jgi:hypothetical protein
VPSTNPLHCKPKHITTYSQGIIVLNDKEEDNEPATYGTSLVKYGSPPPSNRPKAYSSETSDIDDGITDYTRNPCWDSLPRNAKQIGRSRDHRELILSMILIHIVMHVCLCTGCTFNT